MAVTKSTVYVAIAALLFMAVMGGLLSKRGVETFEQQPSDEAYDSKRHAMEMFKLLLDRKPTAAEIEKYANGTKREIEQRIMEDYTNAGTPAATLNTLLADLETTLSKLKTYADRHAIA